MMGVQTTGRREIWGHQDCQTQVLGSSVYLLCPAVWCHRRGEGEAKLVLCWARERQVGRSPQCLAGGSMLLGAQPASGSHHTRSLHLRGEFSSY